jgi:hypothetical protein
VPPYLGTIRSTRKREHDEQHEEHHTGDNVVEQPPAEQAGFTVEVFRRRAILATPRTLALALQLVRNREPREHLPDHGLTLG